MRSVTALQGGDLSTFERAGYLVLPRVFGPDELDVVRRSADRLLALAVNASLALRRRYPRMDAKLHDDGRLTLRKIQPVNDLDAALAAISGDERLLAPMRQLMGDEPILMEEKLNYKQTLDTQDLDLSFLRESSFYEAHDIEGFILHHDWGYYRQHGYPENTLSSAVALDDCEGRGPIRVIPGSHLLDVPMADPDPASGTGEVAAGFFAPGDLVPVDAPAGSVMLFHARLVHDSEPNRSGLPRRVMIYSHYPRAHDPVADPDRRNGPIRTYARDFETRYRDMVARGEYRDQFVLRSRGRARPR